MNDRVWHVRNWDRFQHYKNRNPPWIKLHRELLQDPRWFELEDFDVRLIVNVWMLAAGSENPGEIGTCEQVAFNVRADASNVLASLQRLESKGFVESASNVLAPRLQHARPEGEERERREEGEKRKEEHRSIGNVENFVELARRNIMHIRNGRESMMLGSKPRSIDDDLRSYQELCAKLDEPPEVIATAIRYLPAVTNLRPVTLARFFARKDGRAVLQQCLHRAHQNLSDLADSSGLEPVKIKGVDDAA